MRVESYKIGQILVGKRICTKKQVMEALYKQKDIKKQKKAVPRLCELLVDVPDEKKAEALDFQRMFRAMEPHLPYPGTNTVFGESLTEFVQDKCAVALYITKDHSIIKGNDKLFISDGSHGYFLFLAMVFQKHQIEVVTNNLGVAGEYVLHSGEIIKLSFPSHGTVVANYGGLFDFQAEYLRNEMQHANIFISVEILDPSEGPCLDPTRAVIRRAALESGSNVTILTDHRTLSHNPKFHAKIFAGEHIQTWRDWLNSNYAYIITTPHPEMPDSELKLRPNKRTPRAIPENKAHRWQLYSQNSRRFCEMIGDRFVEVDKEGHKLHYE
jgi:hypothetical protein